jgi:hypothetical protein
MVWRIHFTAEDLERIQVRPTLGPLAETVKAMSLVRCLQQPRAPYRQWRSEVKGRLTPQMTALAALLPLGGKGVDLAMVIGTAPTLEKGVQALLAAPREQLLAEMEFTDRRNRLPTAAWAIAEANGAGRLQLAEAAVAAYQVLVEPYWGAPEPGRGAAHHRRRVHHHRARRPGGDLARGSQPARVGAEGCGPDHHPPERQLSPARTHAARRRAAACRITEPVSIRPCPGAGRRPVGWP